MKSTLHFLLLAVVTAEILTGCGSGSSTATTNSTPTPTAAVGIATPKAVSVVTAN